MTLFHISKENWGVVVVIFELGFFEVAKNIDEFQISARGRHITSGHSKLFCRTLRVDSNELYPTQIG